MMGWVHLHPECEYLQRIARIAEAERLLDTDFWLEWSPYTRAKSLVADLSRLVVETIRDPDLDPKINETYLRQASLANYVGGLLQPACVRCFRGQSEAEIDRVLSSFRLESCCLRQALLDVVRRRLPAGEVHDDAARGPLGAHVPRRVGAGLCRRPGHLFRLRSLRAPWVAQGAGAWIVVCALRAAPIGS